MCVVACAALIASGLIAGTQGAAALIPAVLGFAASVVAGVITVIRKLEDIEARARQDRANQAAAIKHDLIRQASDVKSHLAERKTEVDSKLEAIAQTVDTVHKLVNNDYRKALQTVFDFALAQARRTGSAEDRQAADDARKALTDHDARQAEADRQGDPTR